MQIDRPITIALILFIVLLLVFFLVVPEYKTFEELRGELGEKKAEFNAEFDYYATVARTYDDLQGRKEDIKKIDNALPSSPEMGGIIYYLQQTATENGLIVKDLFLSKSSLANTKTKDASNIKDIIFSMDLLGSHPALESFIKSLENSSRIFEVIGISFGTASTTSVQSTQLSAQSQQLQIKQVSDFSLQIKTHSY